MDGLRSELLARCLEELEMGELVVADAASLDPRHAAELTGLLAVAQSIAPPPPIEVDPAFRARARAQLLATIGGDRAGTRAVRSRDRTPRWNWLRWPSPFVARLGAPALVTLLVLGLAILGWGGTVYAAQGALPGDTLYPVKTAVEQAQVALAASDEAKAQVYLALAQRRLVEIQAADREGRSAAARAAATGLAQDVAQADAYAARASAKTPAPAVSQAVSTRLASLQSDLATTENRTPAAAQPAVQQARAAVRTSLAHWRQQGGPVVAQLATAGPTSVVTPLPTADTGGARPAAGVPVVVSPSPTRPVATVRPDPTRAVAAGMPRRAPPGPRPTDAPLTEPNRPAADADAALAQLIAAVRALPADGRGPGGPDRALLAPLDAAQAALNRGQTAVARRELAAFGRDLTTLEQDGRLSPAAYQTIVADYQEVVRLLGGTAEVAALPTPSAADGPPVPAVAPPDQAGPVPRAGAAGSGPGDGADHGHGPPAYGLPQHGKA